MSAPFAQPVDPGEGLDRAIHCQPSVGFADRGLAGVGISDDGTGVRIPLEHPSQADSLIAQTCGERPGPPVSR